LLGVGHLAEIATNIKVLTDLKTPNNVELLKYISKLKRYFIQIRQFCSEQQSIALSKPYQG
jgi:hypothetical protein